MILVRPPNPFPTLVKALKEAGLLPFPLPDAPPAKDAPVQGPPTPTRTITISKAEQDNEIRRAQRAEQARKAQAVLDKESAARKARENFERARQAELAERARKQELAEIRADKLEYAGKGSQRAKDYLDKVARELGPAPQPLPKPPAAVVDPTPGTVVSGGGSSYATPAPSGGTPSMVGGVVVALLLALLLGVILLGRSLARPSRHGQERQRPNRS